MPAGNEAGRPGGVPFWQTESAGMAGPSSTIVRVWAREILDSRGRPTVEAEVHTSDGQMGRASVPAGASTGRHEALDKRDGAPHRYAGYGVLHAVAAVRELIAPALCGMPVDAQEEIDRRLRQLDGTPSKQRLGANAILAVSLACARAAAASHGHPLFVHLGDRQCVPLPMVNLLSGGLHAGGKLDIQDFLMIPVGATSLASALEMTAHVHNALGRELARRGYESYLVADEGGYGPALRSHEEAFAILLASIAAAGYTPGKDVVLAVDLAASHWYRDGLYHWRLEQSAFSASQLVRRLEDWVRQYPVVSLEDPLAEDDWSGWQTLTQALGSQVQLIGDDLFVTDRALLERGLAAGVANSILIKPNQVGTLSETLHVLETARAAGYNTIVSARSGETEDPFIADLAVATGAGQIKIGCIVRGERLAKYNQLVRIEETLGASAFAGDQSLRRFAAYRRWAQKE